MQLARTSDNCASNCSVASMQCSKYFKLVNGRALLDASDNDLECFLIGHVFSGVVGYVYYIRNESVLHACAKRMIMSLFGFRNPMTGVTLIIDLVCVIHEDTFIDEVLNRLIHH